MFIEQAYKGKNNWWRVLITTFVATAIFILNFVVYIFSSKETIDSSYDLMKSWPKIVSLVANLVPFVFLLALLFVTVHFIHKRSIISLTTSRKKVDFSRIAFSFALVVFFTLLSFGISYYIDNSSVIWNFHLGKFLILFGVSLLLFPTQIGFEEYLFRGYLMQQIGIIAKNRWTPLVITSVFFGLFHNANPEVSEMGYGVMVFYIGTGFLLGIMTLMDESLELSLGFHLGNNLMAALLITSDYSALQTDAVFRLSTKENTADTLNEMILSMVIIYPIILFILAKKYKWTNWKEKLTGRVSENTNLNT
ncbi:CPBP family intramembrane glutamic endopeptidase [Flavobacterium sp. SUN052]|uniref:CPBP family intramembrane glutamic endopeptidase n=1 Tax=Flavobacterium sp. SUN052 TaxID=3002441 RepID=UPI00237E08F9|nr:CPBP family intramembrane glutamic endopeptidase [Flavobacterium sp. SUN052]MEC4005226.1 CPBP family intramembrane glutamic endopeptidase [Flavobacterium sp. SUN052]